MLRPAGALPVLAAAALGLFGCGAGAPLLHPAHVLHAGDVSAGAGLSGELVVSSGADPSGRLLQLAAASGVAPWVSGRVGLAGDNEAGLTYTGRNVRLDVRHAFAIGAAALSVGIGGSLIIAERPGVDVHGRDVGVFGGGIDVPCSSASARRAISTHSGSGHAAGSKRWATARDLSGTGSEASSSAYAEASATFTSRSSWTADTTEPTGRRSARRSGSACSR